MQVPKKHFPVVGLLGLVLVAAVGGSIYYYQFVVPHASQCGVPTNRVIFLSAIIQDITPGGGFNIKGAAALNSSAFSALPRATNSTSPLNFTRVPFQWYNSSITDPKTIYLNQYDNVTVYMYAINSTDPRQYIVSGPAQGHGHGFGIDGYPIRVLDVVNYDTWGSTTFAMTEAGSFTYRCEHLCSALHSSMTGTMVVTACG